MDFDHYTDRSAAIATDLVNAFGTVPLRAAGHGDEPLGDPAAFLRAHGLDDTGVTPDDAPTLQRLADRLHHVFDADGDDAAVAIINDLLATTGATPQITSHDAGDWHLHYHPRDAGPVEHLTVTAAMGLGAVLCTAGTGRFGHCDGIACRDVYVDTSRNNRRRFCSDGCANRAHVTAHRARQRADQSTT